ncbi:hypothetical protein Mtc_0372 [Methanocella conradii HZ254]|uniref:Uncharacterized protein n=1 Tax=Methanocella conradii (strain DSM 24694 / JCM 17849 / CGMCC 1.5162 / HZ254) TaxID=1041930 RepID=H8IA76_METCZ|nr:hypothetical protein [Methanocella conradii]AFC99142.1 hypothetical protein Mtc_0372 [Methanocella conradii HZ254]MDI6896791.1 hypothetical protein [Methanocella conradii]
MDSDTGGGKSKLDLSDIMSMLDDTEKKPEQKPEPARKEKKTEKQDDGFVKKLLSDIEQKNAEILRLSSENTSLKYSLSEKEIEVKKLKAQLESSNGLVESLKAQVLSLSQQVEDLNKYVNEARVKLGEMEADRAKLAARMAKKEEQAPPEEEDVASIFKRIALEAREPGASGEGEQAQKKQKTAKLYDL